MPSQPMRLVPHVIGGGASSFASRPSAAPSHTWQQPQAPSRVLPDIAPQPAPRFQMPAQQPAIQARTLEILESVGLEDEFVQAGNICHAKATYTSDHKLIKYLTFDELDSTFPFVLRTSLRAKADLPKLSTPMPCSFTAVWMWVPPSSPIPNAEASRTISLMRSTFETKPRWPGISRPRVR